MSVTQPFGNLQTGQEPFAQQVPAWIAKGTSTEAIGAAAVVVLSILGLLKIFPMQFAAINLIILGIALFVESAAIAANYAAVRQVAHNALESMELRGGLSLGSIGGIAVLALGILALIGIVPHVLLASGLIVLGVCGFFLSGETNLLSHFWSHPDLVLGEPVVHRPALAASGLELVASIAAIVLGILAFTGFPFMTMVLVGFLALGCAMFLGGVALTREFSGKGQEPLNRVAP